MLLQDHHKSQWNEFVAASPVGDFMQAWEWGELKSRTGWRPLRLALQRDGKLASGMQILRRPLPGGRSLFYAPRGPLLPAEQPGDLKLLLEEARHLAREHRALALKVDPAVPAPDAAYVQQLIAHGLRQAPQTTHFGGVQPAYVMKVDISPTLDDLLASFHTKWRYNIRLAERKGVVIRPGTREDLPVFYRILQETCQRDGFGVRALSYYEDLWDLVLEPGLGGLFMGFADDQAICGAISLTLGRRCWYVYGASSNSHRNLMPNHLLQWEMIKWAKERGCDVYDMRGVAREVAGEEAGALHGLNRFKRGFGAQYMEYIGEFDLVYSPLWYRAYNVALKCRAALRKRSTAAAETSE